MARRRSGLPAEIRSELPLRANAGVGLDPEFPTRLDSSQTCKASLACQRPPSPDMLAFVKQVMDHLNNTNATQIRLVRDFQNVGHPGSLWIVWATGPTASEVAAKFAVSVSDCGTPRLPAWLSLRNDSDFDLRWQPAF